MSDDHTGIEVRPGTEVAVLKRAHWLAFGAALQVGLGSLHSAAAGALTEASVWALVTRGEPMPAERRLSVDYLCGRQMKTGPLWWDSGRIFVPEWRVAPGYQSWSVTFRTYAELIGAAVRSLALEDGDGSDANTGAL